MNTKNLLKLFWDESGATAVEYSIIAGLVVLGIITGITLIGASVSSDFSKVNSGFGLR